MLKMKILILFCVVSLAASLAGCGCLGGGSGGEAQVHTTTKTTTTGQDLIDLKKAHDEGVISDKEYEKAREKILDGSD